MAGEAVDLMAGVDGDCPTFPWGGDEDYAVSPDGAWLVYTAKVVNGSEEAWSTNWDLWAVPTDGSKKPSEPHRGPTRHGTRRRPSHRTERPSPTWPWREQTSRRTATESCSWTGRAGSSRVLTEDWDRSPRGIVWAPDGKKIYASADNVGNHSIFEIDPASGHVQALLAQNTNASPRPLADGRLVFARDSLGLPGRALRTPGRRWRARQDHRRSTTSASPDLEFGEYKQFSFLGAHGDEVFGYFIRPVGFEAGKKYPLALLVHGGPQGSFDDHWHYRWNPQIYAAHGYATVMIDFHGSTGYGQAFLDSIRGDWGGAPYEDLMLGLDDVLRRYKWVDPSRMVALGASYGGFMINWIQGQTDRFAALVCHDGNLDEFMAYFDTEELWFPEWEHGGTPWENPEGYRKHNRRSTTSPTSRHRSS